MEIEQIRRLARSDRHREAVEALRETLVHHSARDHLAWGRLAAELGDVRLAIRELNLALRGADPDSAILAELAELYRDVGDHRREAVLRERLAALEGRDPADDPRLVELRAPDEGTPARGGPTIAQRPHEAGPPVTPGPEPAVLAEATESDRVRFVHLFSGREDVHARMWVDPRKGIGYSPIHAPLTPDLVRSHLAGSATLGTYLLRLDGTVTFFVLDLDITRKAVERARGDLERTRALRSAVREEGARLERALTELGLPVLLEDSGYKGRHLWCFLAEPLPAALVRKLGAALVRALAPELPSLALEFFPKQAQVKDGGLGNLVKLPLGVHLKSGRRGMFLDAEGRPMFDPWPLLRTVTRATRDQIFQVLQLLRGAPDARAADTPEPVQDLELAAPPVQRPAVPPPFTQADFASRPELAAILRGCTTLATIVDRALTHRRLDHDERVVLRHSLGHTPDGLLAVNYLFGRCPEVPREDFLKTRFSGNPISCASIRRRIPHVTAQVACHCIFAVCTDRYPTPLLHLDEAKALGTLPAAMPAGPDEPRPDDLARAYALLLERQRELQRELDAARVSLLELVAGRPDRELRLPEGRWAVIDEEGLPGLAWTPAQS